VKETRKFSTVGMSEQDDVGPKNQRCEVPKHVTAQYVTLLSLPCSQNDDTFTLSAALSKLKIDVDVILATLSQENRHRRWRNHSNLCDDEGDIFHGCQVVTDI